MGDFMIGDSTTFEELESQTTENRKPFFAIAKDSSDSQLLQWFKDEIQSIKEGNSHRHQKIMDNFKRYKGMQYVEQVYQNRELEQKSFKYMPQLVMPLIRDVVDEKIARIMQTKPSVAIIPLNDEQSDKIDAKIAKKFIKHIDNQEKTEVIFANAKRNAYIAGEHFVVIMWNPDKGPELPGVEIMRKAGSDSVSQSLAIGDIEYKSKSALDILYEASREYKDANYFFMIDWDYTEAIKLDYPSVAEQISSEKYSSYYNFELGEMVDLIGKTMKIHFYHRKTKYLPQGFEACFTKDTILKRGNLLYNHGKLPLVRFMDQTNPEEPSAVPQIEYTRGIASQVNNLTNMIIKQINLCAHPKWMIDKGSVDDQDLGNDVGIIKLKPGSRDPKMHQSNPVSPQVVEFAQNLDEKFYRLSKSNSIVQGEPPEGMTAFVAIQFQSEQENVRMSQDIINFGLSVKEFYELTVKTCGQYYKKGDSRVLQIMGKENKWTVEKYDPVALQKNYSFEIQSSTGLPESKAARTQLLVDMGDKYPEMFPREQMIEMIGLSASEKFFDSASAAAASAEYENELMIDGKPVPPPEEYENHLVHWRVHFQQMQDSGFKLQADPITKQAMIDHLLATELLMEQQIINNAAFGQLVMTTCPQFPCLLYAPTPPPQPMVVDKKGNPVQPEGVPVTQPADPSLEDDGDFGAPI